MERKEKVLVRNVRAKSPVSPKASQRELDFYPPGNREPLRILCRGRKSPFLHDSCDKDRPGVMERRGEMTRPELMTDEQN